MHKGDSSAPLFKLVKFDNLDIYVYKYISFDLLGIYVILFQIGSFVAFLL